MFLFGLLLGAVLGVGVGYRLALYWLGAGPALWSPRSAIWDLERRAVREMLHTELMARRPGDRPLESDVVDGTVNEVKP